MNQTDSKHIPILDGIRAYAVLLVCLAHFFLVDESGLYETNRYLGIFLFKVTRIGIFGVYLFFILSGFLITGILLDSRTSPKYFTPFYARRFLRIFPLYYFVLSFSFFVLPHFMQLDAAARNVIHSQVWLWTYISNFPGLPGHGGGWDASLTFPSFAHFWSLCVEEHFYVFWPLLIYFAGDKWLPRIMWGIVAVSTFSVFFVYCFGNWAPILTWSTIKCAGVLSLGGLIAFYRRSPDKFKLLVRRSKRYVIPAGVLFVLVNFMPRQYAVRSVSTFFAATAFFAFLLVVSLGGNKATDTLFKHKSLYFIGRISYGIYIYHGMLAPVFKEYIYFNLRDYVQNGILASVIYVIICTGISILVAWISWRLLESPFLRLKSRFEYQRV